MEVEKAKQRSTACGDEGSSQLSVSVVGHQGSPGTQDQQEMGRCERESYGDQLTWSWRLRSPTICWGSRRRHSTRAREPEADKVSLGVRGLRSRHSQVQGQEKMDSQLQKRAGTHALCLFVTCGPSRNWTMPPTRRGRPSLIPLTRI